MKALLWFIFFLSFLFFTSGCKSGLKEAEEQKPPNILWIMVDDLNDWTGYQEGHPQTLTPNIDRLASQGMSFSNAHTIAPLCGPCRASLLSGLRPSTTGIYFHIHDRALVENIHENYPEVSFLPDYFEDQGYKTYAVGKIFHEGDKSGRFDEYGGLSDFGPRPAERFAFDPKKLGKRGGTSTDWGAFPEHDSLTFDHRIASWAIDKLQNAGEEPFFLAVGFMRPHVPWYVPQKWFDAIDYDKLELPAYRPEDWSDVPEMAARVTDWPMMPEMDWMMEEDRWKDAVHAYLACVHFTDHQIGRVLKALEESEYTENTIVVLASDHGYHLGEKGLFQKGTLWQRSTQIPMIWAGKGIKVGSNDEPASLLDIYPSLVDLAGFEVPAYLEGTSLKALLSGEKERIGKVAVTTNGPGGHSVFSREWHYIQYNDTSEELYLRSSDKHEWHNLAEGDSLQEVIDLLKAYLPVSNAEVNVQCYNHPCPYYAPLMNR